MKKISMLFLLLLTALSLSGCSVLAFALSGCDSPDADLVVLNDSAQAVYAITLDYADQTETTVNANGRALLERGESYGLVLVKGKEAVTVILSDEAGRELARRTVDFDGTRLYLTLAGGQIDLSEELTWAS